MNLNFQLWNINRFIKCTGNMPELFDIISLIDIKLHYPENQENIKKIFNLKIDNYIEKYKKAKGKLEQQMN